MSFTGILRMKNKRSTLSMSYLRVRKQVANCWLSFKCIKVKNMLRLSDLNGQNLTASFVHCFLLLLLLCDLLCFNTSQVQCFYFKPLNVKRQFDTWFLMPRYFTSIQLNAFSAFFASFPLNKSTTPCFLVYNLQRYWLCLGLCIPSFKNNIENLLNSSFVPNFCHFIF